MGNACTSDATVPDTQRPAAAGAAVAVDEETASSAPEEGLEAELALERRLNDVDSVAAARKKKFEDQRAEAEARMKTTEDTEGRLELGVRTEVTVEEFMAVKPWEGAIKAPSDYVKAADSDNAPAKKFQMEWVYGYGGDSARDNVRFASTGELVYHVAAVGLVQNVAGTVQRQFAGAPPGAHSDDITCLDVSADGKYAVTGQIGKAPFVCVWDVASMQLLARLKAPLQRAIVTVAFSADGSKVCATDLDNERTLAVWDWQQEALIATARIGAEQIFTARFAPNGTIYAAGVKSLKVFTLEGKTLKVGKGVFGPKGNLQTLMCMDFTADGRVVTGTFGGDIYVWTGKTVTSTFKAHQGAVGAVCVNNGTVYTGGNDGRLRAFTLEGKEQWTADLKLGAIRSVDVSGKSIAVGTAKAEIVVVDATTQHVTPVVHGHWQEETWSLSMHPTELKFVTGGDEGSVRLWDGVSHTQLAVAQFNAQVRGLCYSPDGHTVAAGTFKGEVLLLSTKDLSVLKRAQIANTSIDELKFSPDGKKIAFGSHDSFVRVLDGDSLAVLGTLKGHHEAIWHLDWSADSAYIQTNSRGYELLFWDAHSYSQITSATSLRDTKWATWTCTLGWPVQGIWPKYADGTDVNSVDRSHDGTILATGDDFQRVNLFKYPCVTKGAKSVRSYGHASHVPSVRFSHDDAYIVSTGGHDRAVIQWQIL